jgi:hypothetical protein
MKHVTLSLIALLTVAGAVQAQSGSTVAGGLFIPSSGSKTGFSLGVTKRLEMGSTNATQALLAYVDYQRSDRKGRSNTITGIGIGGRYGSVGSSSSLGDLYVQGGLGIYTVKTSGLSSKTNFGSKIGILYQKPGGAFTELVYTLLKNTNGFNPSGIALRIGANF